MNPSYYKYCMVLQCKSTTIKTPNKLFIFVASKVAVRKKWLTLARRNDANCLSSISRMYFCKDHFDRSPLSEYLFLPWLGATLRGLFLRQAPTAGALLYTMAVINGNINPMFLTAFSFLFLLEARLWLEIARLVRSRWERRDHNQASQDTYEVETLWSNDDVQSIEVRNYVY